MQPVVQVSIDVTSLQEALKFAEAATRAGVDWLEVGTPLLLAEGLRAVREMRRAFPQKPIVADWKMMDGGYIETRMLAEAGADMVVVMAVAHEATVRAAVRAGKEFGVKIMADVMAAPNKVAYAKRMEEIGVDYIIVHTGWDERHEDQSKSPLQDVEAVVRAVNIPVQAVGGLSVEQAIQMPKLGAPLVVIGAPIAIDRDEFKAATEYEQLEKVLRYVVERVKGGH